MLTKTQRKFLENPESFSYAYSKVIRCRLKKKLRQFCTDYELLKSGIELVIKKNNELNLDLESCLVDLLALLQKSVTSETKNSTPTTMEFSILDMNKMA